MKAFRMGRIAEPWTNLTPPIRGGVYLKIEETPELLELPDDTDDVASSISDDDALSVPHSIFSTSYNSSTTSLSALSRITSLDEAQVSYKLSLAENVAGNGSLDDFPVDNGLRLRPSKPYSKALLKDPALLAAAHLTTPNAYTSRMIQKEIDKDVFEYPSVDEVTQREITQRYKALHQRVKDEGFYDCRYIEYGKEVCRYSLLFMLFMVSLRYEWYITSACFLGAFWVKLAILMHERLG